MLAYLDEAGSMAHRQAFVEWLGEVMRALQNPEAKALCAEASFELARGNYYKALSARSEEHTSELQSLMRISYAVFCLKKKKTDPVTRQPHTNKHHIKRDLLKSLLNQS